MKLPYYYWLRAFAWNEAENGASDDMEKLRRARESASQSPVASRIPRR